MRADPNHDADGRDQAPQAEHRAPIDQAVEAAARPAFCPSFAAAFCHSRLTFAWGFVIATVALAIGSLLRLLVGGRGDAILRAEAQFRQRSREPE